MYMASELSDAGRHLASGRRHELQYALRRAFLVQQLQEPLAICHPPAVPIIQLSQQARLGLLRIDQRLIAALQRHSRGRGVVAYTLLCNHVPLQGWLIGAHEFEAHYVFDVWYRNTSDIVPTAITGDMHSVNKANFAILHWFGLRFEPRFTGLDEQLKELYCADDLVSYEKCLVRPVGRVNRQAIMDEKDNIDRIVATLALKELTQGTLIRKLCTYTRPNPTRRAIFEFDKLIRSIYTLRYLRDPQLQRNVHRSQNRIEAYHQLRCHCSGRWQEGTDRQDRH
jgi:TnpA family transposase